MLLMLCSKHIKKLVLIGLCFTLFKICIVKSLSYSITKVYIPSRRFHHTELGIYGTDFLTIFEHKWEWRKVLPRLSCVNEKARGINGTLEYMLREDWELLVFNTSPEIIQNCYFKKYCFLLVLLFKICFIDLFFLFN